jgi:hypothetical protein
VPATRLNSCSGFHEYYAPTLLDNFEFQGTSSCQSLLDGLKLLKELNASERLKRIPRNAPIEFISPRWEPHVLSKTGAIDRPFYELCALSTLRDRLRAGDVWGGRQPPVSGVRRIPVATARLAGDSRGRASPGGDRWELSELRGSCSVLREPEGETPSGHSPCRDPQLVGRRLRGAPPQCPVPAFLRVIVSRGQHQVAAFTRERCFRGPKRRPNSSVPALRLGDAD